MRPGSHPLYFVTGISGSGKTTVARRLAEIGEVALDSKLQPGLFHFADEHGDLAPDYRPDDPAWSATYRWRLNRPMFEALLEQYNDAPRIFLCGGADDLIQYWPLGRKVFMLKVDAGTLRERLNREDRDNAFGKDEKTQSALLERLNRRQARYIEAGAIPIDACRPIDEVVSDILSQAGV